MLALTVFVFAASTILSDVSAEMTSNTETSFADSTLSIPGVTLLNRLRLTLRKIVAKERFFLNLEVVEDFRRVLLDMHDPCSETPMLERHTLPTFDRLLHSFSEPSPEAIGHHISQIFDHAQDIMEHLGEHKYLLEKKIHPNVYADALMLMTNPFASFGAREKWNARVAAYHNHFHANMFSRRHEFYVRAIVLKTFCFDQTWKSLVCRKV